MEIGREILGGCSFDEEPGDLLVAEQEPPIRNHVLSFRVGDARRILKIFSSEQPFRNEMAALARLEHLDQVPTMHGAGGPIAGYAGWIVMAYLPGGSDAIDDPETPLEAFVQLGQLVASIHRVDATDPVGPLWQADRSYPDWWSFADQAFDEARSILSSSLLCAQDVVRDVDASYERLKDLIGPSPTVGLIHRDLRPANLMFEGPPRRCFSGVLDFEHAMIGDPWVDLSRLHDELLASHPRVANGFWTGYAPSCNAATRDSRLVAYRVLRYVRGVRFALATDDPAFLAFNLHELQAHCAQGREVRA